MNIKPYYVFSLLKRTQRYGISLGTFLITIICDSQLNVEFEILMVSTFLYILCFM